MTVISGELTAAQVRAVNLIEVTNFLQRASERNKHSYNFLGTIINRAK